MLEGGGGLRWEWGRVRGSIKFNIIHVCFVNLAQLSDAGNERIKIFLKDDKKVVSVITDFCDASTATDLTQHIMVKEGRFEEYQWIFLNHIVTTSLSH